MKTRKQPLLNSTSEPRSYSMIGVQLKSMRMCS